MRSRHGTHLRGKFYLNKYHLIPHGLLNTKKRRGKRHRRETDVVIVIAGADVTAHLAEQKRRELAYSNDA